MQRAARLGLKLYRPSLPGNVHMDGGSVCRMREGQRLGMEAETREGRSAVEEIADEGKAEPCKLSADLVPEAPPDHRHDLDMAFDLGDRNHGGDGGRIDRPGRAMTPPASALRPRLFRRKAGDPRAALPEGPEPRGDAAAGSKADKFSQRDRLDHASGGILRCGGGNRRCQGAVPYFPRKAEGTSTARTGPFLIKGGDRGAGAIDLLDEPGLLRRDERCKGFRIQGEEHEARGFVIEAMKEAAFRRTAPLSGQARPDRIEEGGGSLREEPGGKAIATSRLGRGMEARGLVNHKEALVLEDDARS